MNKQGMLIVLSGPSGVGKGTVCQALLGRMPGLAYSVSATTRPPRAGERHGVNYFFKTREEFESMIARDELLEWAEYVGNYYGTPRKFVEETMAGGRDVILEIDVQGALQVKRRYPDGIFVFLLPPSLEELRNRIRGRGTEPEEVIRSRLEAAVAELKQIVHYDYAVVNDRIEDAASRIEAIVTAEHCRRERVMSRVLEWIEEEVH